jgi:hypothetical protein
MNSQDSMFSDTSSSTLSHIVHEEIIPTHYNFSSQKISFSSNHNNQIEIEAYQRSTSEPLNKENYCLSCVERDETLDLSDKTWAESNSNASDIAHLFSSESQGNVKMSVEYSGDSSTMSRTQEEKSFSYSLYPGAEDNENSLRVYAKRIRQRIPK